MMTTAEVKPGLLSGAYIPQYAALALSVILLALAAYLYVDRRGVDE